MLACMEIVKKMIELQFTDCVTALNENGCSVATWKMLILKEQEVPHN